MSTYARNLPTEGCPLPDPPPPPDIYTLRAAKRADRDAFAVLVAMDADLATYGPYIHAAWDRAHLAGQEYARLRDAYLTARTWEGVTAR